MPGSLAALCLVGLLGGAVGLALSRRGAPVGRPRLARRLAGAVDGLVSSVGERLGPNEAEVRRECLRQMPELLDIVILGLSAGLSFDAALELYCSRYDTLLSHAFERAVRSWQMGLVSREEALHDLSDELGVGAIGRFASSVSEALAFGSPLASILGQQASAIREEQRMQMEEQIEKVPVKMLVPMGTLIVPAMLLAILGPLLSAALRLG
ncbi:MAG: type II secretion system F family protein [Atopobiaceae bacterium]|jgi:tight adherence protein C|nr:type II secretion system F family protein [Atopobiaceae bacterium]